MLINYLVFSISIALSISASSAPSSVKISCEAFSMTSLLDLGGSNAISKSIGEVLENRLASMREVPVDRKPPLPIMFKYLRDVFACNPGTK